MRRIMRAVADAFRDTPADAPVHFHQGPFGDPAACYLENCSSPHLKVD